MPEPDENDPVEEPTEPVKEPEKPEEEVEEVDEGPSPEEVAAENARLERERRKYIMRRGGFRADLPKAAKSIAGKINKKLGKKVTDGWDVDLLQDFLPGVEHPASTQSIGQKVRNG